MPLLKILSNSEITEFDSPPIFNHGERKKFFNLPSGLKPEWETLRTDENKILFLLQCGYFRSRQRFFAGHFHPADRQYISAKFNPSSGNEKILSCSRPTLLRHQHIILEFYGVRFLQETDETLLRSEAKSLVNSVAGFYFMPRIRDIKQQQLYKPNKNYHNKTFSPLLKKSVNLDLAAEQRDAMMRVVISLQNKTVPAHLIVQKLISGSPSDRLSRAFLFWMCLNNSLKFSS